MIDLKNGVLVQEGTKLTITCKDFPQTLTEKNFLKRIKLACGFAWYLITSGKVRLESETFVGNFTILEIPKINYSNIKGLN